MGWLNIYTLKNRFLCSFDSPITIASISTQRVENARFIRTVLILAETIPVLVHGLVFAPTNRNNPKVKNGHPWQFYQKRGQVHFWPVLRLMIVKKHYGPSPSHRISRCLVPFDESRPAWRGYFFRWPGLYHVYGIAEGNFGNMENPNSCLLSYAESLPHAGPDTWSEYFKKHAPLERCLHPKIQ